MPRFTLVSPHAAVPSEEFVAANSGQVIGLMHRLGWSSADVNQDGQYLFSLALNDRGIWSIAQRQGSTVGLRA